MTSFIPISKFRSLFSCLLLLLTLGGLSSSVSAQQPWEDPGSTGEKIERSRGQLKEKTSPSLPDQMQMMNRRATSLIQFLQSEVVTYFSQWSERMSQVLAGLIILFSFLRIWRENSGRGSNLFWWFARLGICLGLIGSGPWLINEMYDIGRDVAQGPSADSVVYRFYDRMQANFTESYAKIAEGTFTVKVNKEDFVVSPVNGNDSLLGVLYDQESTIRDLNNRMNDSTWLLPRLFAWLGICRGILEGGDLWLVILAGVLLLAFKVIAPFMVVIAIDQKLAQRVAYPFLWGAIVMTLIWPSVSYFIRGLAYLFGNVAMALGDSAPVYVWNEATMQAFRSAQSQPVYTVLFACFTMTVTALCLWVSPVIAYQISMGRVYEGVSNAASTWAGAVVGTAMEWYSANVAAKLNQQAAQIQATAGYEAETTRAGGELQAANLAARARQVMSVGQVKGSQITQLGQIYSARTNQLLTAQAGLTMGINSAAATAALAKSDIGTRTQQQIGELKAGQQQEASNIETGRASDTRRWWGDKIMMGSGYAGYLLRKEGKDGDGKSSLPVRGLATAIEVGGGAYGLYQQHQSIQDRAARQTTALNKATDARVDLQHQTQQSLAGNQDAYQQQMVASHEQYAKDLSTAANTSASQAAGGVNLGTSVQLGAINRGTGMELQANQSRYGAQVKSAEITRSAAVEAARLHAMERVLSALSHKIARDVERGFELRF
jgi:hypothetical protein